MCPYKAITFDPEKGKSSINEAICKGCGTCLGACGSGAISQNLFEDEEIYSEIDGLMVE
jgi:heterodisulfide reductase subunit A